MKLNLSVNVI